MALNHFLKRRNESGFCSRVSMMATGSGVRSCVPPRSGMTGSAGGATGGVLVHAVLQASGDGIRVRLRGMSASVRDLQLRATGYAVETLLATSLPTASNRARVMGAAGRDVASYVSTT